MVSVVKRIYCPVKKKKKDRDREVRKSQEVRGGDTDGWPTQVLPLVYVLQTHLQEWSPCVESRAPVPNPPGRGPLRGLFGSGWWTNDQIDDQTVQDITEQPTSARTHHPNQKKKWEHKLWSQHCQGSQFWPGGCCFNSFTWMCNKKNDLWWNKKQENLDNNAVSVPSPYIIAPCCVLKAISLKKWTDKKYEPQDNGLQAGSAGLNS